MHECKYYALTKNDVSQQPMKMTLEYTISRQILNPTH